MAYTTADRSDLLRDNIFTKLGARHLLCVQRILNFGLLADRGLLAGVTADRGLLAGEALSRNLHGKLVGCIKDTNRLILKLPNAILVMHSMHGMHGMHKCVQGTIHSQWTLGLSVHAHTSGPKETKNNACINTTL